MKKSLIVKYSEVDKALADDAKEKEPRGLRKVVVPDMYFDKELILLDRVWTAWINKKKPVVESSLMQFSYFNAAAEQKPHWHENQVEIYTVLSGQLDVWLLDVDNEVDFDLHVDISGSVIIPPRFCHLVRVKGDEPLVQVLQFAIGRGPIKDDQQVCVLNSSKPTEGRNCPRHTQCKLENIA